VDNLRKGIPSRYKMKKRIGYRKKKSGAVAGRVRITFTKTQLGPWNGSLGGGGISKDESQKGIKNIRTTQGEIRGRFGPEK